MLNVPSQHEIYVYTEAADMRKGINGLSGLVRAELNADPVDGSLYVFINKRRDRMKILHFDGGGYWIYYRVLEAGTFESLTNPDASSPCLTMDSTELSMLLSGVTLAESGRRRKRYSLPRESSPAA